MWSKLQNISATFVNRSARRYATHTVFVAVFVCFNAILAAGNTPAGAKVTHSASPEGPPAGFDATVSKIVIDAGHGGYDSGALGLTGTREKDITLRIALGLGRAIKRQFPDVQVIYTRKTDEFVSLKERSRIANDAKADLFISIHCNAMPSGPNHSKIHGSETYVLGENKNEQNLQVAKRENSTFQLDPDHAAYKQLDTDSPEWHIFLSMYQQNYLENSILFAKKVEHKLATYTKRYSHGVLQNNFHVLREVAMPSVLVEVGYLTNREDETFLKSRKGQQSIVRALADAFYEFKMTIETGHTVYYNSHPDDLDGILEEELTPPPPVIKRHGSQVALPRLVPAGGAKSTSIAAHSQSKTRQKRTVSTSAKKQTTSRKPVAAGTQKPADRQTAPTPRLVPVKPKESKIIAVSEGEVVETPPHTTAAQRVAKLSDTTPKKEKPHKSLDVNALKIEPIFKIQVAASKKPLDTRRGKLANLRLETRYENGYFKYLTGHSKSWNEITGRFKQLRRQGYKAFIVAYLKDKRIGLDEARRLASRGK